MSNVWILVQIISILFAVVYAVTLSERRYSKPTVYTASTFYMAAISVVNFICVRNFSYLLDDYPILDFIYRLSNIVIALLFYIILCRPKAEKAVFTVFTVTVCVLTVDIFAISFRVWFGYVHEFVLEIVFYSLMLLLVVRIRKLFLQITEYINRRLWAISILPALLTVCIFRQISVPIPLQYAPGNISVALMLCFISAGVYGLLFYLFKIMLAHKEIEHNTEVMRLYAASLEHQNALVAQNAEKAALFRHDIRHVLNMMSVYVAGGDIDGISNLIRHLDKNVSSDGGLSVSTITGNKLLDTVFASYINMSADSGIDISVNAPGIQNIPYDLTELAVVLANALENAVNACCNQPEGETRFIRIDGRRRGRQYFLEIVNTCTGIVTFDATSGLPVSSLKGHGTGVKSIAYFAEKNGAELQFNLEDKQFSMRMLLNLT